MVKQIRIQNRHYVLAESIVIVLFSTAIIWMVAQPQVSLGYDEFYHVLAAQSWIRDGTLSIGDGTYDRASLYTKLVGVFFSVFGENVAVARAVSLIGASLWLVAVHVWVVRFVDRKTAWVSTGLLLFCSTYLHVATSIRFYGWHGLAIFMAFLSFSIAISTEFKLRTRLIWVAFGLVSLEIALRLQVTTGIAAVGFAIWLIIYYRNQIFDTLRATMVRPLLLVCVVLSFTLLIASLLYLNVAESVWSSYRNVALWNSGKSPLFYSQYLHSNYAVFWALFPVSAVIAISKHPRYGLGCVVVFVLAFIMHSFAGMKAPRYLIWALPFFFIPTAISLVLLFSYTCSRLKIMLSHAFPISVGHYFPMLIIQGLFLIIFVLIISNNNRGTWNALGMISGNFKWRESVEWTTDWRTELPVLVPLSDSVDVVVTTHSLAAFYYLDGSDYVLSRTIMLETDTGKEFGRDTRTGSPVISSAESLSRIIECYQSGLILVDPVVWGDPIRGTSGAVNALIEVKTTSVAEVVSDVVYAFVWKNKSSEPDRPQCDAKALGRSDS